MCVHFLLELANYKFYVVAVDRFPLSNLVSEIKIDIKGPKSVNIQF